MASPPLCSFRDQGFCFFLQNERYIHTYIRGIRNLKKSCKLYRMLFYFFAFFWLHVLNYSLWNPNQASLTWRLSKSWHSLERMCAHTGRRGTCCVTWGVLQISNWMPLLLPLEPGCWQWQIISLGRGHEPQWELLNSLTLWIKLGEHVTIHYSFTKASCVGPHT